MKIHFVIMPQPFNNTAVRYAEFQPNSQIKVAEIYKMHDIKVELFNSVSELRKKYPPDKFYFYILNYEACQKYIHELFPNS